MRRKDQGAQRNCFQVEADSVVCLPCTSFHGRCINSQAATHRTMNRAGTEQAAKRIAPPPAHLSCVLAATFPRPDPWPSVCITLKHSYLATTTNLPRVTCTLLRFQPAPPNPPSATPPPSIHHRTPCTHPNVAVCQDAPAQRQRDGLGFRDVGRLRGRQLPLSQRVQRLGELLVQLGNAGADGRGHVKVQRQAGPCTSLDPAQALSSKTVEAREEPWTHTGPAITEEEQETRTLLLLIKRSVVTTSSSR